MENWREPNITANSTFPLIENKLSSSSSNTQKHPQKERKKGEKETFICSFSPNIMEKLFFQKIRMEEVFPLG